MGLGALREFIEVAQPVYAKDTEGFTTATDRVVASLRASVELRHPSSAWVNRATYTKATLLFRTRYIPGLQVTEEMVIIWRGGRYVIDGIENVGARNRYVEILARKVNPSG